MTLFLVNTRSVLPARVDVVFLDVGQGDAILIQSRDGTTILVDGGPDRAVVEELGRELPWFDRKIEAIILTHPDGDHITGLIEVAERYDVEQMMWTGVEHEHPAYVELQEVVREKGIQERVVAGPQRIAVGDLQFEVIAPLSLHAEEINNTSIVFRLEIDGVSFLLTGDAEAEVEEALTSVYDMTSDVLKVGHHGSSTSTSQAFLDEVDPDIAVIQVGAENRFGHPTREVLRRLERAGAKILRNDIDGTMRCSVRDQSVRCQ